MDGFKHNRRLRRLALLAAISCCITANGEAQPGESSAANRDSSFRSLIAQGWKAAATDTAPARSRLPDPIVAAQPKSERPDQSQPAPELPTEASTTTRSAAPITDPVSAVASPQPTAQALAELIKAQARPIAVPQTAVSVDEVRPDLAPIVNRISPGEAASTALPKPAEDSDDRRIKVVEPIVQHDPTEPAPLEPMPTEPMPTEPAPTVAASTAAPQQNEPASDDLPVAQAAPEEASSMISAGSRLTAQQHQFQLFSLADTEPDRCLTVEPEPAVQSNPDNVQSKRLREAARQSLRNAHQRMARRAVHSAKMYALETLRSVVAMQDSQHGGAGHARQLDAALDAIRESRDFNGTFGSIDQNALQRMVLVHETEALKDQDLTDVSALEATEAYLSLAQEMFVKAAQGAREASDALVILGKVERTLAAVEDTHASAVAVTMLSAAVQIAPQNVAAHCELGTTLLQQGLIEQAADALRQSIAIQPTRSGYQRLLEAARRLGDVDTAQECAAMLASDRLPSEIPVRSMSPSHFAATHRPTPSTVQRAKPEAPSEASGQPQSNSEAKTLRVSLRSIVPFGRR